ncbi:MAG: ribonuclease P protein subunit [Candidatus Woesearchaeota archaeon]
MNSKHELIGKQITITDAKNKSLVGITGNIIDETRETLVIETKKGKKRVQKKGAIYAIGGKTISGEKIIGRSEERMKK